MNLIYYITLSGKIKKLGCTSHYAIDGLQLSIWIA